VSIIFKLLSEKAMNTRLPVLLVAIAVGQDLEESKSAENVTCYSSKFLFSTSYMSYFYKSFSQL